MRKIAFVGTARSADQAPFDDETWEIWGVSQRGKYVTRATRWFELHRLDGEDADWAGKWRECVRGFIADTPLYMFYPEPGLATNQVTYPVDHITGRFGTYFMTSTFAWMLALAIDELRPLDGEATDGEIAIFGVDMEYGTEYAQQRAGLRHFLALAAFAGIEVKLLAATGLSYEPVPYPFWQDDPLLNKLDLRTRESEEKITDFDEQLRHTRTMIAQNVAIRQGLERYGGDQAPAEIERLAAENDALLETSAALSKHIVHWEATREEQGWLKDYLLP
jgi:hypothetical protein